jgi:tetratricopeptide (TPR) repeat protein
MGYQKQACALIAVVLLVGCGRSVHKHAGPAGAYFKTPFQDESQFIVETIVSDLAEQMFYASRHQLPDPKHFSVHASEKPGSPLGAPVYELQIALEPNQPDLKTELNVAGPIWLPELYQALTAALARNLGLPPAKAPAPGDTSLLRALTDGKAATIEREDLSLSGDLESDFSNPALHEEAAVLVGAFARREHSGDFYEIRSPLCRMTAHLAMAQYLAGSQAPDINAQIAGAMLLTLMNNQVAALEKMGVLATNEDKTVAKWVRTLQADNSADYRPLAAAQSLSPIERIAGFQAFVISVDPDIAWHKLSDTEKMTPDFARIANEARYSVETGHDLLRVSLPLEFKEMADVCRISTGQAASDRELVAKLNELPGRCFETGRDGKPAVHVIGWGQWAMFFQRQLGHAVEQNFDFLQNKWGVPDQAKTFAAQCDQTFASLRLSPFYRRFTCLDSASYHRAVDDGFKVTVGTPQFTPAECWNYMCFSGPADEEYKPNPNPHINEWHKHNPPPGTAYNPLPRFSHPSLIRGPGASERIDRLHARAPYDLNITFNLLRLAYSEQGRQPTCEQCQEAYKTVLPYATYAMDAVADTIQDQPDRYEALMVQASAPDPARYFTLGEYFQIRQKDDQAAKYYRKGFEQCLDRVLVMKHANWLVQYDLKHGETNQAQAIADEGAEVYSAYGLEAKAGFYETTGRYDEAFQWLVKEEERYDDSAPLISYCVRYQARTGDHRFAAALKGRVTKLFPKGLEYVNLQNFHSAPDDGVLVRNENERVRSAGLKAGNVIVAVNGLRVHNFDQYCCGRDTGGAELTLIVWQGNQYRELKASPPDHRFGNDMGDYIAK